MNKFFVVKKDDKVIDLFTERGEAHKVATEHDAKVVSEWFESEDIARLAYRLIKRLVQAVRNKRKKKK